MDVLEPIDEAVPERRSVVRAAVGRAGSWLKLLLLFAWPAFVLWLLSAGDGDNDPEGTWPIVGVLAAISLIVFALSRAGWADPMPAWARRVVDDWMDDDDGSPKPQADDKPLSRRERLLGAAIGIGAGLVGVALLTLVLGPTLTDVLTQLGGLVILVAALLIALCREIGRGVVRVLRRR